jgi:membrane fusion protein (multidrug efflux system)
MIRRLRRAFVRFVLLVVVPVAVAIAGAQYYVENAHFVTTGNAYVKAKMVSVSAEVSGRIARVLVAENRRVKAGETLFNIDSEPFRIAFQKAEADLARVRNEIQAMKADYRQARIEFTEARKDIAYYERLFERQRKLVKSGHASRARYDEAQRNVVLSRQRASVLRQKALQTVARLGGADDLLLEKHPDFLRAKAARDDAELDLRRTIVQAPANGTIGPIRIENGEFLTAGQPAMPLVLTARPWIVANLKETQLTHVLVGQKARITVDAYPDHAFEAVVQSISPSTGSELAILPPQNASGNWVKIVQRVPVRLALAPGGPTLALRAGMTVGVSIDTGRRVTLVDLIGSAMAWMPGSE